MMEKHSLRLEANQRIMYVKATTADRVKSGRGLGVQLNQLFIGIYNADGEYFAIGDVCPHMGAHCTTVGWMDVSSLALCTCGNLMSKQASLSGLAMQI